MPLDLPCASGDGSFLRLERVSPVGFRASLQGPKYERPGEEHPSVYLTNEQVEGIRGTNG